MTSTGSFAPTHLVPEGGVTTYEDPYPGRALVPLDPGLPVQLAERRGDWARVVCSNGWEAWVDGRLVEPAGVEDRTEVDELWSVLRASADAMADLLTEFAAGRIDEATYRQRVFEAGLVIRQGEAWMVDAVHRQVHRYDGFQLRTLEIPNTATPSASQTEQPKR